MDDFDQYLKQGEPDKAEKAKVWKAAIGLQQVDNLTPSGYLIETAIHNIEGKITIEQVKERIDSYYQQHPIQDNANRTEEADKVSAKIAEILTEHTFVMSPIEYLNIHRRLFEGIYSDAGKARDYNISKKEWVLEGETVVYASADNLMATLEYDISQEKKFQFSGLSKVQIIEHLASFISLVWQLHIFSEGNTRTTAIFLIKYLKKLGYTQVNNDLFADHSWYFRNALVRSNYEHLATGVHKTDSYLIRFLKALIDANNDEFKNREMQICHGKCASDPLNDTVNRTNDTVSAECEPVNDNVLALIKQNKQITAVQISQQLGKSISTTKRRIKRLKDQKIIARVGSDKTGYWQIIDQSNQEVNS